MRLFRAISGTDFGRFLDEAVRKLTRQLQIADVLGFSLGFIGFSSFSWFFLVFPINPGISY